MHFNLVLKVEVKGYPVGIGRDLDLFRDVKCMQYAWNNVLYQFSFFGFVSSKAYNK